MVTLTEENIAKLNAEELRLVLRMELARYDLIVRHNKLTLFRYDIPSGTMYIQLMMPDGTMPRISFEDYFNYQDEFLLDETEHARVVEFLRSIIYNEDSPHTGVIALTFNNGRRVSCEYAVVHDDNQQKVAVVGQVVDMYQTHDRMISTIDTLSEHKQLADAIFASFETIVLVNFDDMSYKLLKATKAVRAVNGQVDNFKQLAALYRNFYIAKEDHDAFWAFVDENTIQERLANDKSVSIDYQTTNIGPCHARIIPVKVQANGHVSEVIFVTEAVAPDDAKQVSEVTTMDALTDVLSLKSGAETINQALQLPYRGLFVYIDIDFFRAINGMLGQAVGDMLLIEVSKVLAAAFPSDIIMRSGSDEFVVYITNSNSMTYLDEHSPEECFERLQRRISAIAIPEMNGIVPTISVAAINVKADDKPVFDHLLAKTKAKICWTKQKGGVLSYEG